MEADSLIISLNPSKFIKDLQNLEDLFDFRNLSENHELFNYKNKKVIGKFKIETPKTIWIDEFIRLSSKVQVYICGKRKNKIKGKCKSDLK